MTNALTWRWIACWVDGGVLGRNPSPRGVYWSVAVDDGKGPRVVTREEDTTGVYQDNNSAEWMAVRAALRYVREHYPGFPIVVYSDSKLVVKQFNGQAAAHDPQLRGLREECRHLADGLKYVAMQWRPRDALFARLGH